MSLRWVCGSCGSGTLAVLALAVFSVGRATGDGHSNDPRGRHNTRNLFVTFSVRRRLEKYVDLLIIFSAFLKCFFADRWCQHGGFEGSGPPPGTFWLQGAVWEGKSSKIVGSPPPPFGTQFRRLVVSFLRFV